MLSQKELKKHLKYCKKTGLFFRKVSISPSVKVGDLAGGINMHGYVTISINSKTYLAHRLAWLYVTGEFPKQVIDHINRVRHDNKWGNLRDVSMSENSLNGKVHKDNKSGVKGVSYKKGRVSCWQARVNKVTIGYFKTIEEAEKAVLTTNEIINYINI